MAKKSRSLHDEEHVKLPQSDRNTKFIGSSEHKHWSNRVGPSITHDNVAFCVKMSADTSLQLHEILIFNQVMTDTAHTFNTGTGIYVVPVSGVYVFTWSCTSGNNGDGAVWTSLRVDGISRAVSYADSPNGGDWESSTGLIVISVNQGVSVYIRAELLGNIISNDRATTTFSGWRLF
ncbi:complement C1q-like protein 2 [Argopecten irradians]|uniref:complement C1q-like protein 2 n=1 Tax=Argopecten irradians TaxID=31199 RepID=UPI00371007A2